MNDCQNAKVSNKIALTDYDKVDVYYKINSNLSVNIDILVADENGDVLLSRYADATDSSKTSFDTWYCVTIDLTTTATKDASYLRMVVPAECDVQVYAYND